MPAELVVRQRVSTLAKALPGAAQGDPVAVHMARVATRRLREALALTRGRASRKVRASVRRLTRALGPIRELDVTLDLLAHMVAEDRVSPAAATCLRESVLRRAAPLHGHARTSSRSLQSRQAPSESHCGVASSDQRAQRRPDAL
jgi:CHAD domain-containing protein